MIPEFEGGGAVEWTRYYSHPDGRIITRTVHGPDAEALVLEVPEGCEEIGEAEALARIEELRTSARAEIKRVRDEALAAIDADYRALLKLGFPDRVARRLAAGTSAGALAGIAEDAGGLAGGVAGVLKGGGG